MSRSIRRLRKVSPFLILPVGLLILLNLSAFRPSPTPLLLTELSGDPLQLPPGWAPPPTPADNPITAEKFTLGRHLFFETALSGDRKTSCGTCHNPALSFASHGAHVGAFGDSSLPARTVPRLMNVGYDSVLTWDGHFHSLEEQVRAAVVKKGDLASDTVAAFARLASNPAYSILFTQAFGDSKITLDRIAKAISTFERCLISGNSRYDQYVNGNTSAMSASAIRGMTLFFDTTKTNCALCHNNVGPQSPNVSHQLFTDNKYYRTGTFESNEPGGGYGMDSTFDSLRPSALDAGRAAVTRDTNDIGRFRTPSLRNATFNAPYGASGTVGSLSLVIGNYNRGTSGNRKENISNQDPRIRELHLDSTQMTDLLAFLRSLSDTSFTTNPLFQDPGSPVAKVDDRLVSTGIALYPNPASGYVNIRSPELTGDIEARLVADNGATIWRRTVAASGDFRLDFGTIANGVYRLELRSATAHKSVPIVLQR